MSKALDGLRILDFTPCSIWAYLYAIVGVDGRRCNQG